MFIVLDGIDGAGKGRQRIELNKFLSTKFSNIETMEFPNHNSPIYHHIIHPALHSEIKLLPKNWFLSFVLDQLMQSDKMLLHKGQSESFYTADGYFTTTLAYQSLLLGTISIEDALDFAKKFDIVVPDLTIYIDVDPKIAMQRKFAEEGHDEGVDIFEGDLEKQLKLRDAFKKLANENVFCKWDIVDGNASIEEVTQNIINSLKKFNLIN